MSRYTAPEETKISYEVQIYNGWTLKKRIEKIVNFKDYKKALDFYNQEVSKTKTKFIELKIVCDLVYKDVVESEVIQIAHNERF